MARGAESFHRFFAAMLVAMQIALLRGVNVGGKNKLPMAEFRGLCERIGLREVQTCIQSGNVVFRREKWDVARRLEEALSSEFDIRTEVTVRTAAELREVVLNNPFPGRDPRKLIVSFPVREPLAEGVLKVAEMGIAPEEVKILGCEMFIYF